MEIKHFDVSILEDIKANGQQEIGLMIIELLASFIEGKQIVVIERRPTDGVPIILNVLKNVDSDNFIYHWKELFNNL